MVIKGVGSESSPIILLYDTTTEELSNPSNNHKSEIRQEENQDNIAIQNVYQLGFSSAENENTEERDPNGNDRQVREDTPLHSFIQYVSKGVEDLSSSPNLGTIASFEDAATAIYSMAREGISKLNLHQAAENPTEVVMEPAATEEKEERAGLETALASFEASEGVSKLNLHQAAENPTPGVVMEPAATEKEESAGLETALASFEDAAMAIYSTASEAASTLESMGKSVGEALESVSPIDREDKEMITEVEAKMCLYRSSDMEVSIGRSVDLMGNCVREALESIPFGCEDAEKIAKIEAKMLERQQMLQDIRNKLEEARIVNKNLRRSEAIKIRNEIFALLSTVPGHPTLCPY